MYFDLNINRLFLFFFLNLHYIKLSSSFFKLNINLRRLQKKNVNILQSMKEYFEKYYVSVDTYQSNNVKVTVFFRKYSITLKRTIHAAIL